MSREKQIEEMARMLSEDCGSCENCMALGATADGIDCTDYYYARKLYKAGYRKASEVVDEIIAKIEDARERWEAVYSIDHFGYGGSAYGYLQIDVDHTIYELKKKYKEGNYNDSEDQPFQEVMWSVLGDMTKAQAKAAIEYFKEKYKEELK